jgi:hypothetical protein
MQKTFWNDLIAPFCVASATLIVLVGLFVVFRSYGFMVVSTEDVPSLPPYMNILAVVMLVIAPTAVFMSLGRYLLGRQ